MLAGWLAHATRAGATAGVFDGPARRPLGLAAALLLAAVGVAVLRRLLRGRGDVAVAIDLAPEWRGSFSVRLRRERERRRPVAGRGPANGRGATAGPAARASTRLEHNMVARETHFRGVPARSYHVVLDGVVRIEASAEGVAEEERAVYEEREVRVERGRTVRLDFDLRPRQCRVEVRVMRSGRPVRGARVSCGGDPTSLRLARDGTAHLGLATGRHELRIGAEDRAAERALRVADLTPQVLVVDLDDASGLVFQDCPGAVDGFLQGDLSVAAAALERAGQQERADLLAGRFHRERGDAGAAADRFEAAGHWGVAAELRAQAGDFSRAADLYERAGDPARAADMFEAAGDRLRAGRAYEAAGDLDSAVACFREVNDGDALLSALEKQGQHFEAGMLALERGEAARAVRSLQQVEPRHEGYLRACRILAETFHAEGKLELAVQKADEAITFSRPDQTSPETFVWYGNLLDAAGRIERALRVFEELRAREPDHPHLATRIDELRKKLSVARRASGDTTQALGVPGAFSSQRYELLEEIGSGGMGVVYRARDTRLGRDVALKRLPENLKDHPRAVELFLREARAAAALNHTHIVTVHDVDQEDGHFFITMELLVGAPLSRLVKARGRLTPHHAARLAQQVAAGLAYAHGRRIVHRDVKTSNLFFTAEKVVKIMDFGLAKSLEEVRRASTVMGGTPYYMAPEQASGEGVDHRADLYALGATLFEMVTGTPPFTEGDIAYHHRHTPPPDPREREPALPAAFAELIGALLAKDPAARPESAEAVGRRLAALADALRA